MIDFKRIGTSDLFQMTPGTGDVGVVVYLAPLGQTLPDPLPLDKAWTRYNGMFIWLQKLPSDATAFASAFRSSTPTDVPHASFAWVDGDPDDLSKALVSQMTLAPGGGGPDIAVTTGAPQPQIQFRQVGFFVIRGNDVSLDQGTGRFTITNTTAGIYLTVVDTDIKKLGPKVTLDLQGSEQGAFAFQILGLVQNDISADNLDTALYYTAAQQGSSKPAKYRFPLLDLLASTDPAGRQIDLAGRFFAADQISSYMSFDTAKAQVLGSYLRTDAGHSLEVQPLDGARLDFSLRPPDVGSKDFFYFTPAGGFELVAPATGQAVVGADEEPPKLLCGLTGTEGIAIVPRDAAANGSGTPGDVAYFFSRQPAYAPSLGQGGDEDGPILTDTYTTSYLAVGPNPAGARESLGADGATVTDYFAQPPDSALYARNTGVNTLPDGQQFLGLLEPVAASLPAPTAATSFPVAPYAGFAPSNTLAVQQLEAGALAPRRKQIISKVTAVTRAARAARAEARLLAAEEEPDPSTTPQGLLTKVMDSRWSDLRLAHNEGEQLTFDTVSEPFRNSLQSSKLFLVVSSDGVLGQFSKQISIGGWPFSIDLGASGSSGDADGNFTNILIFKFYDKSIVDLAGDGSVWAKSDDPDKPFNGDQPALQKWLTETYIPNIEKQAEEQPELYQTFLEDVLQNPAWNGILALEVSIPAGQLPEEVRGLLGGIDIDKFRVNHFGINLNKVDDSEGGGDGGFDIKTSSLFALIDYDVTGDEEQSEFLRSLEAGVDDAYAFKVLTLKVLFGNTEIQHFESRIELTINSLFDEPAEGSEGEGEDQNKIELQGSYERQDTGETDADGKPIYNSTYTFTYEGEKVFNIAESLPAASRVIKAARFTKVQFTTVSDKSEGNKSTITSTFGFFGELEFGEGLDFDFFSFEKLAFADMKIGMAFELIDDRVVGRPAFVFDPGDLRFDVAVSQTRQDSLLGNFPLRLQGFTFATAPFDVTEDGFLAVPDIVPGLTFVKKAIFGLNMVLRLGSMGGLTSGKEGFEIELLAGWLPSGKDPDHPDGGVVFGLKLPSSSGGEKEIGIQGVLTLSVEDFGFQKLELSNGSGFVYALFLKKSVLKILGTQIPPGGNFSLLLFVPQAQGGGFRPDFSNTGWFVAYEAGESSGDGDGDGELLLRPLADGRLQSELLAARPVREDGGNGGGEGGSSILKLDYLGIGQRIVLRDAGDLNNVQEVIDAMKEKLLPESGDDLIEQLEAIYDPERGWLIGADLTLFEIVRLAAVFYDPELYGLLIAFTEKASLLKNFSFEILYKRISDTVGVYKIVVKLPDTLRQLEFGAVSVQLPTIGVDIFTNGDFRLDFGFPAGNDFSESFGIQAIILGVPVLGFGGFYFAKLSSETSETVPKDTPVKGSFNPVLELGFGFSIGVGKTIEKGIFRAGLSVTFQGILEGTAAWWTPDPESVALVPALAPAATPVIFERAPDFYLIKGTFSVVGELYGAVDFGIVKAGVEVRIWVTIGATFESYADLVLFIEAGVRVRITIVIGSFKIFGKKIEIKISFSFSTTVRATFTIADKRRAPWDDGSLFAARRARQLTTSQPVGPIPWQSIELPGGKSKLPILFSPQNTIAVDSNGKQWTQCVNTFAVTGLKTEGGAAAPFVSLMRAMVAWTVNQALALPPGSNPYDQSLSADDLEVMLERLAEPVTLARTPNGPLAYYTNTDGPLASGALRDFLAANFDVTLSGTPDGSSEVPAAIFPVLPDLQVKTTGQAGGDESVQFWSFAPKTVQFQDDLAEYFAKLLVNFDVRDGVGQTLLAGTPAV
ncbi:MAG: hypothetical protein KDD11_09085, partial [Acidobacteria bacterium]|nr:hypothetical protein [Acidobacteriota bacterium]